MRLRWRPHLARRLAQLVGIAALACAPAPVPTAPSTPRIVSLVPAFTETIAALDASEMLVGRSDWCTLPAEVQRLPSFGTALSPSLEALARAAPTLVLVDASGASRSDDIGRVAPVESLPWLTLDDVVAGTRTLGARVGRADAAEALARRLQTLGEVPPGPAKPALLVLGDAYDGREVWYVMPSSLHGAALRAAGGRSVIPDPRGGPPVLSPEALLRHNPERLLVLLPTTASDDVAASRARAAEAWSRWTTLAAVQTGRVAVIAGPSVLSTGPSILETRDALQAALAGMP